MNRRIGEDFTHSLTGAQINQNSVASKKGIIHNCYLSIRRLKILKISNHLILTFSSARTQDFGFNSD
jgi:hypothetical protein